MSIKNKKKLELAEDGRLYVFVDDQWSQPELDDFRYPKKGWVPVANASEFKSLIKKATKQGIPLGGFDFDNDLGDLRPGFDGYGLAKWLISRYAHLFPEDVVLECHSMNSQAARDIREWFKYFKDHKEEFVRGAREVQEGVRFQRENGYFDPEVVGRGAERK